MTTTPHDDFPQLPPPPPRIGDPAVFAGDWAWTDGRVPLGFPGILTGRWNGWCIFTCSRTVAEAIVADHQPARDRVAHTLTGLTQPEVAATVDEQMARLYFDGDDLVYDGNALADDPTAILRTRPDGDGRYTVCGGIWCWRTVDPADCDRIAGEQTNQPGDTDLPAGGGEELSWIRYQTVHVQLTGGDGNAFAIIGTIRQALHREVSADAAAEFTEAAMACRSYDELLALATVTVNCH